MQQTGQTVRTRRTATDSSTSTRQQARTRIGDVALAAGVSKAAVSFAFNSPERLKSQTAERIREVATALGYRPHPVARMLTAGSTATIGIISPNPLAQAFANPFFALFAEGVSVVTEDHGFGLLFISPLHGSLERAVARATVDGVIVIGLDDRHPEVDAIRRTGIPTVLVDAPAWPEHGAIAIDDTAGSLAAARHLLELGHRDLLILTLGVVDRLNASAASEDERSVAGRRLLGYRMAFEEHEILVSADHMRQVAATFEGGEAAFQEAWEVGLRPTGVLSMSDAAAAGVLQAARRLGLSVPEDLSIVGFDDLPLASFTDPPLTTVHQPVRQKGEEAARMLLRALSPGNRAEEHVVLDTRLVVRGSTAPPRRTS